MYQIDNSTAAPALPAPSQPGTPGFFTDGNLGAGVAPTIVPAEFLNMLMMEMVNVVTGAGLVPSKSANNQLFAAIKEVVFQAGAFRYVNASQPIAQGVYGTDTSAGSITLDLPAKPVVGTSIQLSDITGSWGRNVLVLKRNGKTIGGKASDLICNIAGEQFTLFFTGSDWRIF